MNGGYLLGEYVTFLSLPIHGASRLVQAMPSWSVKTRHAPSRHRRDARVYNHTTTPMHEIEYIFLIEYIPPSILTERLAQVALES